MDIISFESIADEVIDKNAHTVHKFVDGKFNGSTDVVIIGIDSIFDYEENRSEFSEKPYITIAILESEDDFDIFKNFGIDAWILSKDIDQLNTLLNMIERKRGKSNDKQDNQEEKNEEEKKEE